MTTQPFEVNRSFTLPLPPCKDDGKSCASTTGSSASSTDASSHYGDLQLSQVLWQSLARGCEKRTTLQLRFVPADLCTQAKFGAELARAGLDTVVDLFRVWLGSSGKRSGLALVNAVDAEGVIKVAKYFHGRRWGTSIPVEVTFAVQQGHEAVEGACLLKIGAGGGLQDAAPWRIGVRTGMIDSLKSDDSCNSVVSADETAGDPCLASWPPPVPRNPELAPGLWIDKTVDLGSGEGPQPVSFKMGAHPYWTTAC
eukprot:4766501-Amphidinium_carterae.3